MSAQRQFAAALLPADPTVPAALRAWNGSDPGRRFDVHRNNVMASLVRALEDGFPVTCQLVGAEFYRAMARDYVRAQPPSSPVLLDHGAGFAEFIAGFTPAAAVPFLADMARLERARVEAFHAADAAPLGTQDFAPWLATPERLMQCRVALHPSLRLLRGMHGVLALWAAHQPDGEGLDVALDAASGDGREDLLVLRPELEVTARRLAPGLGELLSALAGDARLGEALQRAAADPAFELDAALAVLVHGGATVALAC